MFRKGGSADGGITSLLRQGYNTNENNRGLLNDLSKDKKSIKNFSEHISLFVRIVESYSSGKYTYVPWKSIALIVAGILYFIYPVDLIPDFIPISGIIDDVALIAWIYKSVDEDIQKFLEWEKSHKS